MGGENFKSQTKSRCLVGMMERWSGKVAIVTGASAGIGVATVEKLVNHGVNVVGIARRHHKVMELADKLKSAKGKVYSVKADMRNEDDIIRAFRWVEENVGTAQILINNAGVCTLTDTEGCIMEIWKNMFEVNVFAVGICMREFISSLKSKNMEGHIVNIASVVGQKVIAFPGAFVYSSTKHALKVITEGVRRELIAGNVNINVSSISPGLVNTELFEKTEGEIKEHIDNLPCLTSEDVAESIIFTLRLPSKVRVSELLIQDIMETL